MLVNNKCSSGMYTAAQCHEITGETVKNAIFKLKSDKDDEVYNLCTNSFIHASDLVFEKLGQLITIMIRHGLASEIVNTSIIKPIPKNKKKLISDSNNYRAISKNTRQVCFSLRTIGLQKKWGLRTHIDWYAKVPYEMEEWHLSYDPNNEST